MNDMVIEIMNIIEKVRSDDFKYLMEENSVDWDKNTTIFDAWKAGCHRGEIQGRWHAYTEIYKFILKRQWEK